VNTETLPASAPVLEASTRLDIAIVGLHFGRHILDQLHGKPAQGLFNLSAVADLHEKRVSDAVAKFNVTGYHSLEELLERDSSPIIGLFTPPKGRAQLIRRVIRAGRDVLTTKPFELDPAEAQSVLREARDLGRVVQLNSPAPVLSEDLLLIKKWRVEHKLGRAVGGSARVWAPYFEKADGTWLDDPKTCPAAPLYRLGIYLFNDFNRIFGHAESIQLMTSSIRTGRPTPDNAQVNIKYRNGALGNVFASFCVEDGDHYQNSMVLNFERGTIYRNAGGLRGTDDMNKSEILLVGQGEKRRDIVEHAYVNELSGQYQWGALAEAVRDRTLASDELISDIVEGLRLIDAMRRAEDFGSAIV
jgi:predicted dehydrogenase